MEKRPFTFDSSNSFVHPLPNLFSRNKSESRLPRPSTVVNPNQESLVSKIRLRKHKSKLSVDPELAAAVVKGYLLPMFEAKSKSLLSHNKTLKYSTEEKTEAYETRLGTSETVYSDLKLTQKLMQEIEILRQELDHAQRETKEANQALNSNQEEMIQLKEKFERLELNSELLKFQIGQQYKIFQRSESRSGLNIEQLNKYKKLYYEAISREEELLQQIHKERAQNDIRFLSLIFP